MEISDTPQAAPSLWFRCQSSNLNHTSTVMNPLRLATLSCGLALTIVSAPAQLLLSGHTTGSFEDLAEANTSVVNAPDGSSASFHTGVAVSGSTQSMIEFTNVNFANVGSGDPIQIGLFKITNGMTVIGSGAPTAKFNVGVELISPEMRSLALSTITFHIDHTPNIPSAVPDVFSVSFGQPSPIVVAGTLVKFHVNVEPASFQIAENASVTKGDITVTFTPVPEPATYAAGASLLLVGLAGYRRFRRSTPSLIAA
jgi:hypothetical protein